MMYRTRHTPESSKVAKKSKNKDRLQGAVEQQYPCDNCITWRNIGILRISIDKPTNRGVQSKQTYLEENLLCCLEKQ